MMVLILIRCLQGSVLEEMIAKSLLETRSERLS